MLLKMARIHSMSVPITVPLFFIFALAKLTIIHDQEFLNVCFIYQSCMYPLEGSKPDEGKYLILNLQTNRLLKSPSSFSLLIHIRGLREARWCLWSLVYIQVPDPQVGKAA